MQSLTHEIHFWIGKLSTPDKYGTAAYRTIDLYRHVSQSQHYHILNDHDTRYTTVHCYL